MHSLASPDPFSSDKPRVSMASILKLFPISARIALIQGSAPHYAISSDCLARIDAPGAKLVEDDEQVGGCDSVGLKIEDQLDLALDHTVSVR